MTPGGRRVTARETRLARRALVRWLYEEVQRAAHAATGSEWIERRSNGKFGLKRCVRLHMYVSTVPCKVHLFDVLNIITYLRSIRLC